MSFHWSTHQLTEYLAAVSAPNDEDGAVLIAVERAAEAMDAEVGAAVLNGQIRGCFGLGRNTAEPVELIAVTVSTEYVDIEPLGEMHVAAGAIGRGTGGTVVVARSDDPFDAEERQMLQGMAQVLGLVLRGLRTQDELRTRQRLLEILLDIQRAVSTRRPLSEILDAITTGAATLLDNSAVALVLCDPLDARRPIVASTSHNRAVPAAHTVVVGAAVAAMDEGAVVTHRHADGGALHVATPVYVDNEIAGSLVADTGAGPLDDRRDMLTAFAQQVSMALTDARAAEAVQQAYHDALTGLPNRRLFLDRLQNARSKAQTHGGDVTLLFIDLDRFKAVNDSFGHHAGDELLTAAAGRIHRCLRSDDTAARLGGDEFAVILEGSAVVDGVSVAERIITELTVPFDLSGHEASISASIGVAPCPVANVDPEELLSNADVAMYRAKKDGSGHVVVFEPRMHAEVRERLNLHTDLREALGLGQLALHYQPMVRLSTGEPAAVEALLRWNDPVRGAITPSAFIPLAEETGLIIDIGRWVLAESVRQIVEWRRMFPDLRLSVNISARQVADPGFVRDVADLLFRSGLPARALTLELTESVLMRNPAAAHVHLARLKELGIRVSIDDFGTGYSSLSHLRQFPVDEIKIDESLIAGIRHTSEDLAVVRAVVELARALHLDSVAEGVETADQRDRLSELGCSLGQGYFLSRPLAPEAVPDHLARAATDHGAVVHVG